MKVRLLLTALVLAALAAPQAHADVVFNNFGAADAYNPGAWEIRGLNNISRQDRAKSFVPTQTYSLTTIELALYYETGDNRFTTLICADSGGQPGAVLGSATQPATAAPAFTSAIYASSFSGITLSSGTTYWVVLQALTPATGDGGFWWGSSPTGDTGHSLYQADIVSSTYAWTPQAGSSAPVVRVSGKLITSAPEPTALVLLCLGIPVFLRKRNK
jgi:hypothetical protein